MYIFVIFQVQDSPKRPNSHLRYVLKGTVWNSCFSHKAIE